MERRIESEKHETSLFPIHSESARIVIETVHWTGPGHEPKKVLCKQNNRPDHDCFDFAIVFIAPVYDVLKAKICDFINVAVMLLF